VCIQLENWLNHQLVPEWARYLTLIGEVNGCLPRATGPDGIDITIIGPMVLPENDNGRLNWQTDMIDSAKELRAKCLKLLDVNSYKES